MTLIDTQAAAVWPQASACTCPSGDGSLRWPCPEHPPSQLPKMPGHPEPHTHCWSEMELRAIAEYGQTCYRKGLADADPTRPIAPKA